MSIVDQIVTPDNLRWAWEKSRDIYRTDDAWCDELEVARFEANLDRELESIARSMTALTYRISPLKPLPQPKKQTDPNEKPVRQTFWIPVRDQVAWIAVVNVIGPGLDLQMPSWSYAYRLYRPVWYDDEEARRQFRRGPFRHTSGRLYRPFRQSWPLYRRHISLTVRKAAHIPGPPPEEAEANALSVEEQLSGNERLPYLVDGWWTKPQTVLYRAHIDLRRFYPNISLQVVHDNLCNLAVHVNADFLNLLGQMLQFPLDLSGLPENELAELGLPCEQHRTRPQMATGLPTGLFVAGFLSNVAMLEVDRAVTRKAKSEQVAHFRYVDDHTILATSVNSLLDWIAWYRSLLQAKGVGVDFHPKKIEPKELQQLIAQSFDKPDFKHSLKTAMSSEAERTRLQNDTSVDPEYPTPLLTATLAKISGVARTPFALLDQRGQGNLVEELEFLLAAQLPDDEIRDDTRVSFAMSRLSALAPRQVAWIDQRAREHQARRIAAMFFRSLRAYPEKLRLWLRILDFCRDSGMTDLSPLWKELRNLKRKHEPSAAYLRAYLKRYLASRVIQW